MPLLSPFLSCPHPQPSSIFFFLLVLGISNLPNETHIIFIETKLKGILQNKVPHLREKVKCSLLLLGITWLGKSAETNVPITYSFIYSLIQHPASYLHPSPGFRQVSKAQFPQLWKMAVYLAVLGLTEQVHWGPVTQPVPSIGAIIVVVS